MTDAPFDLADSPDGIDPVAWRRHALPTVSEMGEADRAAIAGGVPGIELMRVAGKGVADAVRELAPQGSERVAVLCGPGNNGGDGFVAAALLAEAGYDVRLGLFGDRDRLKGDAALAAEAWTGTIGPFGPDVLADADVVVDAVFGAGLDRPIGSDVADVLATIGDRPVVAVDVPSGVSGDTGARLGAVRDRPAALTVTFFRRKPGHLLLPGRVDAGETRLVDIGIPETVMAELGCRTAANHPDLWRGRLPRPTPYSHKYSRGYVFVVGGAELIGAACLTTRAAQRAGAGMVTVACPPQQAPLYRLALESAVVRSVKDTMGLADLLSDTRIGCGVIGPGLGVLAPGSGEKVLATLRGGHPTVLDADALTLFQDTPETLFELKRAPLVLTPHDGEFARLFPDLAEDPDKVARARAAAARSGAVIVLKGFDTVIADPGGWAVINESAPPTLATAGAGDVLAGMIAAFLAGGMPPFLSACAATYIHGAAAERGGIGLTASDLPDLIPDSIEAVL
jgi:hydroxyethylthiazole kinase-like uncharacterized protein yjeF